MSGDIIVEFLHERNIFIDDISSDELYDFIQEQIEFERGSKMGTTSTPEDREFRALKLSVENEKKHLEKIISEKDTKIGDLQYRINRLLRKLEDIDEK